MKSMAAMVSLRVDPELVGTRSMRAPPTTDLRQRERERWPDDHHLPESQSLLRHRIWYVRGGNGENGELSNLKVLTFSDLYRTIGVGHLAVKTGLSISAKTPSNVQHTSIPYSAPGNDSSGYKQFLWGGVYWPDPISH